MKKLFKKLHKQLIPGIFSIIAVSVVLAVAFVAYFNRSLGWFSSSRVTNASGMSVRVNELPYELAVKGANIGAISYKKVGDNYESTPINDFDEAINAPEGDTGNYAAVDNAALSEYNLTSASADTIIWKLTNTYNPHDEGLGPGSKGELTFYILPKTSGDLNVTIRLNIDGYSATVEKNEDYTFEADNLAKIEPSDPRYSAVTYLNSHILFFTDRHTVGSEPNVTYYYTGLIDDKLELSLTNCTANVMIPVTLYWTWPNTFAQYMCISASGNVADTNPDPSSDQTYIDDSAETVAAVRQYIIDNSMDILKGITEDEALSCLSSSTESPYTFDPVLAQTHLTALSTGYNRADQEVGTTVHYFLLTLAAGAE